MTSITGNSFFDSELVARVEVGVALVNELAITQAGGRPLAEPCSEDELVARSTAAVGTATAVEPRQARQLRELALRLRVLFAALHESRFDAAQELLNEILADSGAVPHVHRSTAGRPWHLHFHTEDAGLAQGWSAGCAIGLAHVLSARRTDRLGACAAPACDRVFLDLTRNRSRRFCSTACQERVKAAHHRARRAAS